MFWNHVPQLCARKTLRLCVKIVDRSAHDCKIVFIRTFILKQFLLILRLPCESLLHRNLWTTCEAVSLCNYPLHSKLTLPIESTISYHREVAFLYNFAYQALSEMSYKLSFTSPVTLFLPKEIFRACIRVLNKVTAIMRRKSYFVADVTYSEWPIKCCSSQYPLWFTLIQKSWVWTGSYLKL